MKRPISLFRSCVYHFHNNNNQVVLGSTSVASTSLSHDVAVLVSSRRLRMASARLFHLNGKKELSMHSYVYHDHNICNFVVEPLLFRDGVVNSVLD